MDVNEFAEFTHDEQVRRLELLGRAALVEFGIEPASIAPLAHAENTTFAVVAPEGKFCLRICRPGYQSDANVESEIFLLRDLAKGGMSVPKPYANRVVKASVTEVSEPRNCVLFHWLEGEFARPAFSQRQAYLLGQTMAAMHAFTASWTDQKAIYRQHLHEQMLLPMPFLETDLAISDEDRALMDQVAAQSKSMVLALPQTPGWFGLVHGDMHNGNVLFDGETVRLIDFDDMGWAFWIYDFASALAFQILEPGGVEIMVSMLAGYESMKPLPPKTPDLLPSFLAMRFVTVGKWMIDRKDNPQLQAAAPHWVAKFCQGIRFTRDPNFAAALSELR